MSFCLSYSSKIVALVGQISEEVGKLSSCPLPDSAHFMNRNRDMLLHSYLVSESNILSLEQVTSLFDGEFLPDMPASLRSLCSTQGMYESFCQFSPNSQDDLLLAYSQLMQGKVSEGGLSRNFELGIASPAEKNFAAIRGLLRQLRDSEEHPLVISSLVHYHLRALSPFQEGNENIARLWQLLILSKWHKFWSYIPFSSQLIDAQEEYDECFWNAVHAQEPAIFVEMLLGLLLEGVRGVAETADEQENKKVVLEPAAVSEQIRRVLDVLGENSASSKELMQGVGLKHRPTFLYNYLQPALAADVIEMVFPHTPRSRNQRYRLTEKGRLTKM